MKLIWYSLSLIEYIPSGVYMIKCHSVPESQYHIYNQNSHSQKLDPQSASSYLSGMHFQAEPDSKKNKIC